MLSAFFRVAHEEFVTGSLWIFVECTFLKPDRPFVILYEYSSSLTREEDVLIRDM